MYPAKEPGPEQTQNLCIRVILIQASFSAGKGPKELKQVKSSSLLEEGECLHELLAAVVVVVVVAI